MLHISNQQAAYVGYCYCSVSAYLGSLVVQLSDVRESHEALEARERRNTEAQERAARATQPGQPSAVFAREEWIPPSTLEFYSRKVVGSVCFAGLIVVAIVEHLARLVIALVVALPALAKNEWSIEVGFYASTAVMHLIDNPLRFVKGIVQNARGENFSFEGLELCCRTLMRYSPEEFALIRGLSADEIATMCAAGSTWSEEDVAIFRGRSAQELAGIREMAAHGEFLVNCWNSLLTRGSVDSREPFIPVTPPLD